MDTVITLQVVRSPSGVLIAEATRRALGWFRLVEQTCSRFDATSEVMRLIAQAGRPVTVSPLLFEALRFALEVAELTDGAFDPTVGYALERRGFNRNYLSGEAIASTVVTSEPVSYRDVELDAPQRTVTLAKPLILDLGAVVKGLAIDLAVKELAALGSFSIDAGGDLYLAGRNSDGGLWRVGIRHPREAGALIATLLVSDAAVCTSGDYERRAPGRGDETHLIDPRTGHSPNDVVSATVVAPNAMLADTLSTAAFVLGPERGLRLLEEQDVEGLLISASMEQLPTAGFASYLG